MPRKKPVATDGRETNEQFVMRVMNDPKNDPVMSIFVIEALRLYAIECAGTDADKLEAGPISGHWWKRCAIRLCDEINKHLGE